MMISQASAMAIVNEISVIIKQHVNLMDEKGIIVASTDEGRFGQFHEGAWRIITEQLDELLIENDDQYFGSKKGLNLPLVFQGRIIGVIGVTGNYAEILKYSQIIRKMTELMLADNYLQKQKHVDELLRKEFYDDWIFSEPTDLEQLARRGENWGIDVRRPHRVIVVEVCTQGAGPDMDLYFGHNTDSGGGGQAREEIEQGLLDIVREVAGAALARNATRFVLVIPDEARLLAGTIQAVLALAERLNVVLQLGVDGAPTANFQAKAAPSTLSSAKAAQVMASPTPATHSPASRSARSGAQSGAHSGAHSGAQLPKSVHTAWLQATKACRPGVPVSWYNNIGIEIIMDDIPQRSREAYVARIFNNCTAEEKESWSRMLMAYFDHNGSIKAAADELFIHKNTLQNRINHFAEKTGFDPRNLKDSALIYLALLLDKVHM